tara:strand:+ start:157 stop:1029 length:873 start_codon:yes stop_codon:yes gene_type:complete
MLKRYLPNKYCSLDEEHNFSIIKTEDFLNLVQENIISSNHKINFYVLFLVTDNIGRHAINDKDYYYSKGTLLAIRKNQTHKFYPTKTSGFLLFFKEEFLNRYLSDKEISETIQIFNELLATPKTQLKESDFNRVLQLVEQIEQEFSKVSDEYSHKVMRSLLHVLITLIHRIKSKGFNKVQLTKYLKEFIKFQNLLEENYSKTKKVEDYAQKMGFSTKKLNTIVDYVVNTSVKSFIDDVVIIKAKKYLLHTNLSVKEVAFKLGFKDPTNFYKYFKKHTRFTPEMYKKRYKG